MIKQSGRLYAFIICILISIVLWLLIRLSGEFSETTAFPIVIKNSYKSKILALQPYKSVLITYKTTGFKLTFPDYFTKKKPLIIDLSKNKLTKKGNLYKTYICLAKYLKQISDSLNISDEIISIRPDTLTFYFQDVISKKVPVISNLTINLEKQFELYKPIVYKPDIITVTGLKKDIDKITHLETESKVLNKLNKNMYISLKINKPKDVEKISVDPKEVVVFIPVEKFTEGSVMVPITVINNLRHRNVKIFPDKVQVNYQVSLKDYNKINPLMFIAAIDFKNLKQSEINKAKIQIINHPLFTRITKIFPEKVEFIIW